MEKKETKKQKKTRTLKLHRETLKLLDEAELAQAAGGFVSWKPCMSDQDCV